MSIIGIRETLEVILATDEVRDKIGENYSKTGTFYNLINSESGDFASFAAKAYDNNPKYYDEVYSELYKINKNLSNSIMASRKKRQIASTIYHRIIANTEKIHISNELDALPESKSLHYNLDKNIVCNDLATLIVFTKHPEIFTFEELTEYLSLKQCTIFDDISIQLAMIWNNQVEDNSNEFNIITKNCSNNELLVIRTIINTIKRVLGKSISYTFNEYQGANNRDSHKLVQSGKIETCNDKRFITASFPTDIIAEVIDKRDSRQSNYGYIEYDDYFIKVPLYYILDANANNKKVYIPIETYMDSLWNYIEKTVENNNN